MKGFICKKHPGNTILWCADCKLQYVYVNQADETNKELAESLETSIRTIERCKNKLRKKGYKTTSPNGNGKQPKTVWKEKGENATATIHQVRNYEEAIATLKPDLSIWEVVEWTAKTYDGWRADKQKDLEWVDGKATGYVKDQGKINTKTLYSIFLKFKRKVNIFDTQKFRRELIEDIKKVAPPTNYIHKPIREENNLLVINIFDLHLNRVSWLEEVNNHYDVNVAAERFKTALETLVNRTNPNEVSKILFPIGNDFFNSDKDYPGGSYTSRGTIQESDVRWQKAFRLGRNLIFEGIEFLKEIAPVDIITIPGNHDTQKSFYIGDFVECKYENDSNVSVNNSSNAKKYYLFESNLIGFTHGNNRRDKPDILHLVMANEQPELWAKANYKYWYLGHVHKSSKIHSIGAEDTNGVIVEWLPSPTSVDLWHHEQNYVGTVKGCKAMLHNAEQGQIATFSYNLPYKYLSKD